ncbi:MAG: Hin recombinase [Clostridia bacterium]|nr:Hin recombinase [Clostridia bacterium]
MYETKIKPYLAEIQELMAKGVPKAEIAEQFGISESTLYKYQREIEDFKKAATAGRGRAVRDLENAAFQSAIGHYVTVGKGMKCVVKEYDENGKVKSVRETVVPYEETQYIPPNAAVLCFLLKNWSDYSNDPQAAEMRKKEYELKKAVAKENNFDLEV